MYNKFSFYSVLFYFMPLKYFSYSIRKKYQLSILNLPELIYSQREVSMSKFEEVHL